MDIALPRMKKSNMDSWLPNWPHPYTLKELPHLPNARRDNEEPMCMKARTERLLPSRENP
jgi:hypothetical protein